MAVLSRVSFSSQQRLDLQHVIAEQSFQAADFRYALSIFNGLDKNYVVRGLEITSASDGLSISVGVANCMILCPLDGATSFYVGLPSDTPEQLLLPQTVTAYVEAYFERVSDHPVTTAQWDPGAITSQNPDGTEFTSSVNFEEYVNLKLRYNTAGFSENAIKIAVVNTESTKVDTITDARDLFYRLATGGAQPDYGYRYPWSDTRGEPNVIGDPDAIGTLSPNNPYYSQDQSGVRNDKAINSLKQWMDAVTTSIAEIKGTPYWYSTVSQFIGKSLFFDSINGSTCIPKDGLTLDWDPVTRVARTVGTGPISWMLNAGPLTWNLGGTFVPGTRAFVTTLFSIALPAAPTNSALMLRLEREKVPNLANESNVAFGVIVGGASLASECVKGNPNDFAGIAVGDYIRKFTDSYYRYVKVTGISDGTTVDSTPGNIATIGTIGLVCANAGFVESTEPYLWFRANYSQEDLYYSTTIDPYMLTNGVVPITGEAGDLYFMGRRNGDVFNWRTCLCVEKTNVKVVKDVVTADLTDLTDTVVNHGFLLGDRNFSWSVIESATGRLVYLDGVQSTTGVTLKRTFEPLTVDITFMRTPYVRN
jgi:hypothetical protein